MLRINVEMRPSKRWDYKAWACQLHITDNFTLVAKC